MTARASKFVREWLQKNLGREPSSRHLESAETLTGQCLIEADKLGIYPDEIEEEIGDLHSFIKEAMESTADEEGDDEDTV